MVGPTLHSSSQSESVRVHSQRWLAIWRLEMDWYVLYKTRHGCGHEILDSARCGWNAVTPATALLLSVSCCEEAAGDSTGGWTGEPGRPEAGGEASGASGVGARQPASMGMSLNGILGIKTH